MSACSSATHINNLYTADNEVLLVIWTEHHIHSRVFSSIPINFKLPTHVQLHTAVLTAIVSSTNSVQKQCHSRRLIAC